MKCAPYVVPLGLLIWINDAAAQSVVACRDRNMNIVACAADSGSDGSSYSGGGMYGLGSVIGAGIVGMFQTLLSSPSYDDDIDYAAIQRQQQEQQERNTLRQANIEADLEAQKQAATARQQQFGRDQQALVNQMRPLGTTATPAAATDTGALQQLNALTGMREITAGRPEATSAAASAGFDSGTATAPSSGPLMQVKGVPKPGDLPPQPQVQPAPDLKPMTMDQRMIISDARREQKKLDELRARRAKNEIDEVTFKRQEAELQKLIDDLQSKFVSMAAPYPIPAAARLDVPTQPQLPSDGGTGKLANLVTGTPVFSCQPTGGAACLEIRNRTSERVKIYLLTEPGVFCTIDPGMSCSRPTQLGLYRGYGEFDDGRRTPQATLDLQPQGVLWQVGAN